MLRSSPVVSLISRMHGGGQVTMRRNILAATCARMFFQGCFDFIGPASGTIDGVSVFAICNSEKEIDRERSEDEACSNERAKQIGGFQGRSTNENDFVTNPLKVESISRD